jgi:hypothetical protein
MRFGMSWPAGHGRREWISMGPLGWLAFGWIILLGVVLWVLLQAVLWLILMAVQGVAWLVGRSRERRALR